MSIIRDIIHDKDGLGWMYGKFDSDSVFHGEMSITIYGESDDYIEYAEKCVVHYNRLKDDSGFMADLRDKLAKFMYYMRNEWEAMGIYDDIAEDTDKAVADFESGGDILKYLTRPYFNVEIPEDGTDEIGYSIVAECPWEPEHQCSIIVRGDQLKYVGPDDGSTPWDDEDQYYCIWLDEETE